MGTRKSFIFLFLFFITISLTVFFFHSIAFHTSPTYEKSRNDWNQWKSHIDIQSSSEWEEFSPESKKWIPFDPNLTPRHIYEPTHLQLKMNLKKEPNEFQYMFFSGIYGSFQVVKPLPENAMKSEQDVLYSFGMKDSRNPDFGFFGYPWHIIPIPPGLSSVILDIYSNKKMIGPFGKNYYGSLSSIFWIIFTESWERIILGVFFIFLGVFTTLFIFDRTVRTSFLIFGLFCILIGIYTITRSPGRLFYFDNHISWTWLNLFSVYSIPSSLFLFLGRFFFIRKYPILTLIAILHGIFLAVSLIVSLNGIDSFLATLPFFQYMIAVTGPIGLLFILGVAITQRITNQWIILIGFVIFFLFSAHESLAIMGLINFSFTNIYWGMLVLILSMAFVLVRRFTNLNHQLIESNKNLNRLLVIQEELESAKNIQLSLIPQVYPKSPNWDVLGHYTPMDKVGGDFYDIFSKGKHELGIFLSDVSGHGLSTALLSSMVKVAFSQQIQKMAEPAKLLSDLNQILTGKCGKEFITACYIYFNWQTMKYRFSHAGHHAIIHYSQSNREFFYRRTKGRILGVWEGIDFQEEEYSFQKGDLFFIYSDGILEVGNERDEFPNEIYLEEIIQSSWHEWKSYQANSTSLPKLIESGILSYIQNWRGIQGFEDDISFVIVQAID